MNSSKQKDHHHVETKQEEANGDSLDNNNKVAKYPSTSRQWAGFKNPRIVRVSRAFGGKDRHSKVCTIRGLRDRRIRLSVPTAIQLYDLQDRLGLSQPSKVVDWLLDATKHDIDKLPPLQMPPGNFISQFNNNIITSQSSSSSSSILAPPQASSNWSQFFFNQNSSNDNKKWNNNNNNNNGNNIVSNDDDEQENLNNYGGYNFFPLANQSCSFPGIMNMNSTNYNSYFHNWEPNSSLSLSPFGLNNSLFTSSTSSSSSSSSHTSDSHNNVLHSPMVIPSSLVPPYLNNYNSPGENELRQFNHLQLLSSSRGASQQVLPNGMMMMMPMPTLHLINSPVTSSPNKVPAPAPNSQENGDNCRNISR